MVLHVLRLCTTEDNLYRNKIGYKMSTVNSVTLIGNLGQDPEVRHTQDGSTIVQLSIATSDTWKDKSTGERRERSEWHRVVIFNEHLCKVAENYLKKGSKVYLVGALQTRKWTDSNGVDKYTTEICLQKFKGELVMLDARENRGLSNSTQQNKQEESNDFDQVPF